MTRPAGWVKEVSKSRGSGHVGSRGFKISRIGSGRVTRLQNISGRVGSGWVKRFPNLAGRVGSGRVGSGRVGSGRVGSGRVKRFSRSRWSGRVMTREIRVTRDSSHHDPRVVFG